MLSTRARHGRLDAATYLRVVGFSLEDTYGVELVRWPADEAVRQRLARAGVPRLLLVEAGTDPPADHASDEDWVRLPADRGDVRARARRLSQAMAGRSRHEAWVDPNRILHRGDDVVALSSAETAVVTLLLAHPGTVVDRHELESRVWPESEPPSERALDAVVYRLRRRLVGLGMHIRVIRARGFVLHEN